MDGETATDHELLEAWRNDDADAGNELVKRHFASIFAFLRTKVPDHVDELVQHTFLACVEAVDRIDETRSFRAYLFGIARRQVIYHYRRNRRDAARFDPMLQSVRDAGGTLSRVAAARQEQQRVLDALGQLPLDLQCTLELHYWEHMTVNEVAQVLEVPPGTVKSRLYRARALLREALAALGVSAADAEASIDHLRALRGTMAPPDRG